jgi:hypothetical protein
VVTPEPQPPAPRFRIWLRRQAHADGPYSVRFEVFDGKGILRVARPGVLIDPPARPLGFEERLTAPQVRASRFLLVWDGGRARQGNLLGRLDEASLERLELDRWVELGTHLEGAFRYLVLPAGALRAPTQEAPKRPSLSELRHALDQLTVPAEEEADPDSALEMLTGPVVTTPSAGPDPRAAPDPPPRVALKRGDRAATPPASPVPTIAVPESHVVQPRALPPVKDEVEVLGDSPADLGVLVEEPAADEDDEILAADEADDEAIAAAEADEQALAAAEADEQALTGAADAPSVFAGPPRVPFKDLSMDDVEEAMFAIDTPGRKQVTEHVTVIRGVEDAVTFFPGHVEEIEPLAAEDAGGAVDLSPSDDEPVGAASFHRSGTTLVRHLRRKIASDASRIEVLQARVTELEARIAELEAVAGRRSGG